MGTNDDSVVEIDESGLLKYCVEILRKLLLVARVRNKWKLLVRLSSTKVAAQVLECFDSKSHAKLVLLRCDGVQITANTILLHKPIGLQL